VYLLDTTVISALRKPRVNRSVVAWVGTVASADLYLSVLTIGEIERGIAGQLKENPVFAGELTRWLDVLIAAYGEQILPMTVAVARRWGRLSATIGHKGVDLAIAATALEHKLTVATQNVGHFAKSGVPIFDPFSGKMHSAN
jgi:predicted nucleic acid-binding protein